MIDRLNTYIDIPVDRNYDGEDWLKQLKLKLVLKMAHIYRFHFFY